MTAIRCAIWASLRARWRGWATRGLFALAASRPPALPRSPRSSWTPPTGPARACATAKAPGNVRISANSDSRIALRFRPSSGTFVRGTPTSTSASAGCCACWSAPWACHVLGGDATSTSLWHCGFGRAGASALPAAEAPARTWQAQVRLCRTLGRATAALGAVSAWRVRRSGASAVACDPLRRALAPPAVPARSGTPR